MNPKRLRPLVLCAVLFASIAALAQPTPRWDNNSDAAFVRQILPVLLGRKARGSLEVQLLVDLIEMHGREPVLRMLMEQSEFRDHWTALLTDMLRTRRPEGGGPAQSAACFDAPEPASPGAGSLQGVNAPGALAAFVRDADPLGEAYEYPFTMQALMRSALVTGDLRPVYRAYLWVLASHPPGSGMRDEHERRAEVGIAFDDIYLNRNMECLSCHRGTYSTTGLGQRTHPLYRSLDLVMYDHLGVGELPTIDNDDYQASCQGCHGVDGRGGSARGIRDLGLEAVRANLLAPQAGMPAYPNIAGDEARLAALVGALNGAFGQQNLGDTAFRHYGVFRTDLFEDEDGAVGPATVAPFGMDPECAVVRAGAPWQEALDTFFAGFADSQDASTIEVDADFASGYAALAAALDSLPAWDAQEAIPGDVGFAYMVAAKIVDNVWEQVMGERLTISNQFARNAKQAEMHRHLVETVFVPDGWSLKSLLVAILDSRYFNRRAPLVSALDGPYTLPALFDPFNVEKLDCDDVPPPGGGPVTLDPVYSAGGVDGGHGDFEPVGLLKCAYNSAGDVVHRFAPRTLFNSVSAALDWPAPRSFPGSSYPDFELNVAIGQYLGEFQPGAADVGFQSLLAWDTQFGLCEAPMSGDDWVDRLVTAVDLHEEDPPLRLRDVVLTMKDWLLQEPILSGPPLAPALPEGTPEPPPRDPGTFFKVATGGQRPTGPGVIAATLPPEPPSTGTFKGNPVPDYDNASEVELLEVLFDMDIDDPVSVAQLVPAQGTSPLRALCGVYLKSPQFMLAGLVRDVEPAPPRLRVCNEGPCSYREMCEAYVPGLVAVGAETRCGDAGVTLPLALPRWLTGYRSTPQTGARQPDYSRALPELMLRKR